MTRTDLARGKECREGKTYDFERWEARAEGREAFGGGDLLTCEHAEQDECDTQSRRTRLMKMIRSSGTPCSMSTSTAFMAEPPVAG